LHNEGLPACRQIAGPEKEQDAAGIFAIFAEGCCAAVAVVLDAAKPAGNYGVTGWPATRGGKLSGFRSPVDSTGVQTPDRTGSGQAGQALVLQNPAVAVGPVKPSN